MHKKRIKIGFFVPSLTSGGAERIMAFISQAIAEEKFETVLVSVGHEKDTKYDVSNTKVIYLNQDRVLTALPALYKILKTENFDVAMSAIRHMNALMGFLSLFFKKTKFIGREANVMSVLDNFKEPNDRDYPNWVYKFAYRQLDAIVCQSNDMLNDLSKEFPQFKSKYKLINNPITDGFTPKEKTKLASEPLQFITVASLEPRKGHLRVLEGLALLDVDFKYYIIGKGSLENEIFTKAEHLGIREKVKHIPFTKEIKKHLADSNVFIQGSYVEGFPNALLESCAVGTPVIAFNAPGGINEIVQNGENGFIIENPSQLKDTINKILNSDNFTPEKVSKSVFEKYHSTVIINRYEKLFEEINTNLTI